VSVVLLDVVTTRRANLHNAIARLLDWPADVELPARSCPYIAAYRPLRRNGQPEIDIWTQAFAVGDELPTVPLRLTGDVFIPVEFETAYTEACRTRRLIS